MNLAFLCAAVFGLATFITHVFVGGVHVVRPLLSAKDLTPASRWLNYYCWHITSLVILVIAGSFLYASGAPDGRPLALLFTGLTAVLSALSAAVALRAAISPFRFPSTSLFALIAVSGVVGLVLR